MRDRIASKPRRARAGGAGRAVLCLVALAALVPAAGAVADVAPHAVRDALAGRTLRTTDGEALTWGALRGEVVVVNFWASWCKPCRREMPGLDALNRDLAGRGGRVVAVSIDEDAENVRRFARALDLTMPVYRDGPDGLVRTLDLEAIPTTFVLDRTGAVVYQASGSGKADLERVAAVARRLADATRQADGGAR